jgi:membrane peptidoglycan carboxypeptidase
MEKKINHTNHISENHKKHDNHEQQIHEYNDYTKPHSGFKSDKAKHLIDKHAKITTEYNQHSFENFPEHRTNSIGQKNSTNRSQNLDNLRKKFGFSWNRFGRKFLLLGIGLGLITIVTLSLFGAWLITIWNKTPDINTFNQPVQSSIVYDRGGKELFKFFSEERREVVGIEKIPRHMQLAILALEDENFYYNESGIPWSNLIGATFKCVTKAGDNCRGASGLSQQLVKNITGDDQATISRKLRELFTAIKLNQEKNKQEIIAMYLNQVPFGRNAYGIQEASKSYFQKNVDELTIPQACYLASMVQKPSTFSQSINTPDSDAFRDLEFRKNTCLQKLNTNKLEGDNIDPLITTEEELKEFQNVPLDQIGFVDFKVENKFPHFRDYVTAELRKLNISEQALYTKGYKITTTIDPEIQRQLDETFDGLGKIALDAQGVNNGAGVILDGPSGQILAMRGSRDYNNEEIDGQVNIATSPQQPGSSIKPYVFLSAFDKGFNPATTLIDNKMDFGGGFKPKNFTDKNNGIVSIRTALQNSYNIPAVKGLYLSAGGVETIASADEAQSRALDNFFSFVDKVGLEFPCIPIGDEESKCADPTLRNNAYRDRCFLSTSIGGCEVTLVSHATGINTILQDGNLRTATPFIQIIDPATGTDIFKNDQQSDSPVYPVRDGVVEPALARQTAILLSDWRERGIAFCNNRYAFRCPLVKNLDLVDQGWDGDNAVAAKTGTTDEIRDMWTVGGSPYFTVVTWAGNTDNTPASPNANSAASAGLLWKDIMIKLHEGKEKKGFSKEGLTPVNLDSFSGLLGSGKTELLTDKQKQVLEDTETKLNSGKINPNNASVFVNRGVVVKAKLRINKGDGLLAVDGKTRPENIFEKVFTQVVPEFPVEPWKAIASAYNARFGQAPTEFSKQNQLNDDGSRPAITVNLSEGSSAPKSITASSKVSGSNEKQIIKMEIFIDGNSVASSENNQVSFDLTSSNISGTKSVRITAIDSFGGENEIIVNNVIFSSNQIIINNPDTVSLANQNITVSATSSSNLTPAPTITISQGASSGSCSASTKNGNNYSCKIPTSIFQSGPAIISLKDNSSENLPAQNLNISFNL